MKGVVVFAVIALGVCGCQQHMTSQEVERAIEQRRVNWITTVARRYDYDALLNFVRELVAERKTWSGLDLASKKVGERWIEQDQQMTSGDWHFATADPKKNTFTLYVIFPTDTGERGLYIRCVREGPKRFQMVDFVTKDFTDQLELVQRAGCDEML